MLDIVSIQSNGGTKPHESSDRLDEDLGTGSVEVLQEIANCITRLYKMTRLVRQAAPTDLFAKALSRNRYHFDEQYDVCHVGEKFPKLAKIENKWLRKRLGRAITQRRRYLSYIQDHRDKLEQSLQIGDEERSEYQIHGVQHARRMPVGENLQLGTSSRPSTFFTKATTVVLDQGTPEMLTVQHESDSEDNAKSYTTTSRSIDGDLDTSATVKIPKLEDLRAGNKKEVECPFCFRVKRFRNERALRRHVFSDLRTYVCTFPECGSSYFGDINDWFRHEMENHRVSYECQLCPRKVYENRDSYVSHICRNHPSFRCDGEEQAILNIARKPLDQLKPQDCPCCTNWVDRLRKRAEAESADHSVSSDMVYVAPDLFKRHLASHLEQLALFAVPFPSSSAEEELKSMDANGRVETGVSHVSAHSSLASCSPASSSVAEPLSPAGKIEYVDPAVIIGRLVKFLASVDIGEFANSAINISEPDPNTVAGVIELGSRRPKYFLRRQQDRAAFLVSLSPNLPQELRDALLTLKTEKETDLLIERLSVRQKDTIKSLYHYALIDAYASLTADEDEAALESIVSPASGSPISSIRSPSDNITRSAVCDPLLQPSLDVAPSSVGDSSPDPTPYPAFLQPCRAAQVDRIWNGLQWAAVNRAREGMAPTDDQPPHRWARCSGDSYTERNR